ISITYYDQVDLSNGNITIYQIIDSKHAIIRQIVSGVNNQYCSLSSDGNSVIINVISSTFNSPGQKYYIQVDTDFVKSRSIKDPLLGVQSRIWQFSTDDISANNMHTGSIQGLLHLTADGTQMFLQMNNKDKSAFFASLKNELSQIIPVKSERLSSREVHQVLYGGAPFEQVQLFFTISDSNDNTQRSASLVVQDLNTMVRNSDITIISVGNFTKYLDKNYGFVIR
ncbi:27077_t:CDS:2, partial [Racocetra persica]